MDNADDTDHLKQKETKEMKILGFAEKKLCYLCELLFS